MIIEFLADGFEVIEALTPVDVLKRAGAEIVTVSINETRTVVSSCGVTVQADALLKDVALTDAEAVILPGGMPGASNLRANETVCTTVLNAAKNGRLVAAICAAPYVLGELGLLEGKNAICYPGFEDKLHGASVSDKKVVRDGNIITAAGMGVALDFSLEIASYLYGKEKAEKIIAAIMA